MFGSKSHRDGMIKDMGYNKKNLLRQIHKRNSDKNGIVEINYQRNLNPSTKKLTKRDEAISIASKCPPKVLLKPQQPPVLLTATANILDAQACSAPVPSNIRVEPI